MYSVFIRLHSQYKTYLDDLKYIAMEEGFFFNMYYYV